MDENLLTMREATAYLKVHRNTLKRWVAKGLVPAYKVGPRGMLRFRPDDLRRLRDESRVA